MNSSVSRPEPDELEVSLFGGDFGESVVLHLGEDAWVVVDSCVESGSPEPRSLKYLRDLGIDVESQVKLIVISHWHDDHIRGIGQVVRECESADVAVSAAFQMREFLTMVAMGRKAGMVTSSGVDEFSQILGILDDRKRHGSRYNPPCLAGENKLLYRHLMRLENGENQATVFSLSPSDTALLMAQQEFSGRIDKKGNRPGWIPSADRNHSSVVLWVSIGNQRLLLGADMEYRKDSGTGWAAILGRSNAIDGRAAVFKVSHHGAETGDDPAVWQQLLCQDPFAILTGLTRGQVVLPTNADIERITSQTSKAYITAFPSPLSIKEPGQRQVREALGRATRTVRRAQLPSGHIRLRKDIGRDSASWRIELFGHARQLAV